MVGLAPDAATSGGGALGEVNGGKRGGQGVEHRLIQSLDHGQLVGTWGQGSVSPEHALETVPYPGLLSACWPW